MPSSTRSLDPEPSSTSEATSNGTHYKRCYCDEERQLGQVELNCIVCKRWVHKKCFRNLTLDGLPFMVSYTFVCMDCSNEGKEKWSLKTTNFTHMCIMALANLEYNHRKNNKEFEENRKFFNIENDIIPYVEHQWENLTSKHRPVKSNWHFTISKTLTKETDLFMVNPENASSFSLKERNLFSIGPMHVDVVQLYKRATATLNLQSSDLSLMDIDDSSESGIKTRGASKRRQTATTSDALANVTMQSVKRAKNLTTDSVSVTISGTSIDYPFNREGYRYYLVEADPTRERKVTSANPNGTEKDSEEPTSRIIPGPLCRLLPIGSITLSPNDRAHQMVLNEDCLTITGFEGYCVARATHSVSHGTWYFEVKFISQPSGSHTRIGWSQADAVLQACLGCSRFSYSWRSKHGTVFHDARGHHYMDDDYKQGDVMGCMIHLPSFEEIMAQGLFTPSEILPSSKKECDVIRFKNRIFFEEKETTKEALKRLRPLLGSKIEFFLNGRSCGIAFSQIYFGAYFPAVSIFRPAKLRCNFGPKFEYPPITNANYKPMSGRVEEIHVEQAISDALYMVEHVEEIQKKEDSYHCA